MMTLMRRRFLGALTGLALALPTNLAAAPTTAETVDTLRLSEVAELMRQEGLSYAEDLERDMLAGSGGAFWMTQVGRIYDTGRMVDTVAKVFDDRLSEEDRTAIFDFFGTEEGQGILTYENAARAAMADEDVEEVARATYADLKRSDDARLAMITRFVEANDLLERNVAGALGSNFQFFRGLADGGAYEMSEDEILTDVWNQETEIRNDTEGWLYGFLLMAYRPLSDDTLERYIAFSQSEEGQALNSALFEGFDVMYRSISYALGLAAAQSMAGSDL